MEHGQIHGLDKLQQLKDQMQKDIDAKARQEEEETYAKFKQVFDLVTEGRPASIPMAMEDAPEYLREKNGISKIEYLGTSAQTLGNDGKESLTIVFWPNTEGNIPIGLKIDENGGIGNFTGGEYPEVEKTFNSFGLTKTQLAYEAMRYADALGINFYNIMNAELFPEKDEPIVTGAGEGIPGSEEEDPERLPFLKNLQGSVFGVAPAKGGLKEYRGVVFPGGIIFDCKTKPNAVYGLKVGNEAWREGLGKIRDRKDQQAFIAKIIDPTVEEVFISKKQAQEHPDVTCYQHNTSGTWKDRVMQLAESYQ